MWSIGALLELDDRAKMEEFTRGNFELDLPPIDEGSLDTIFEFLVNEAGSQILGYWKEFAETHLVFVTLFLLR